jgi:hypothetical protein
VRVKEAPLVSAPETPLTLMGKLPAVAVLLAVKVTRLVPAVFRAANDAVTPLGSPDADRITLLLKRFCGVTVTVPDAVAPRGSPRLAGSSDRVKFGAVIVSPMVVALVSAPEAPFTIAVYVSGVTVPLALKVRDVLAVVLDGLKTGVKPVGKPDTAKLTLPLKPFKPATLMVLLPLLVRAMVRLLGDDERLKLGTTTVSPMVVVLLRPAETPLMLSG